MKFKFIENKIDYDGTQLASRYAYLNHGVLGDSIIAFVGGCDVSFEHMVDGEDLLAGAKICGSKMIHFIVEEFGPNLETAVRTQRLFAALAFEHLAQICPEEKFSRRGDDIYSGDRKFSISIATVSPVSTLIHFAMNVSNEGTPVKTCSFEDFKINPIEFARQLSEKFIEEIKTSKEACSKVNWVR